MQKQVLHKTSLTQNFAGSRGRFTAYILRLLNNVCEYLAPMFQFCYFFTTLVLFLQCIWCDLDICSSSAISTALIHTVGLGLNN